MPTLGRWAGVGGGWYRQEMIFHAGATVTYQVKEERDAVDAVKGGRHLKMQTALTPHAGLADGLHKQLSATWHQHADRQLDFICTEILCGKKFYLQRALLSSSG